MAFAIMYSVNCCFGHHESVLTYCLATIRNAAKQESFLPQIPSLNTGVENMCVDKRWTHDYNAKG